MAVRLLLPHREAGERLSVPESLDTADFYSSGGGLILSSSLRRGCSHFTTKSCNQIQYFQDDLNGAFTEVVNYVNSGDFVVEGGANTPEPSSLILLGTGLAGLSKLATAACELQGELPKPFALGEKAHISRSRYGAPGFLLCDELSGGVAEGAVGASGCGVGLASGGVAGCSSTGGDPMTSTTPT